MTDRIRSQEIFHSSNNLIPGGVNSPARSFSGLSMTPLIAARGKGDTLWDADGKTYIDFCCSWGALILGHAPDNVVKAVQQQVALGSSFGLATEIEERLAKKMVGLIPSVDKIRFVSSGTEATMSALRLARGCTGRSIIVKFDGNYHGHSDGLLIKAGSGVSEINPQASSKGIPAGLLQHTLSLPYNDAETAANILNRVEDLAAVIVEPIAGNMGVVPASREFLQVVREITHKKGAILIFDEVITGFRVSLKGAQDHYGIQPDLTCFGKIIGGGFPAAAFGGKAEIMDHLAPLGEVYQAGTLSGNPVAMTAGLETLCHLETPGFYGHLETQVAQFLAPIETALKGKGCIQRCGSMFTPFLGLESVETFPQFTLEHKDLFKRFFYYLFERGIYIPPSPYEAWFISSAHTEQNLQYAQETILTFLKQL